MSILTGFGDLAVLLPASTAILVWLLAIGAPGAAARWVAAVALCMGGIGLLKVYLFACAAGAPVQSPSGHSGVAALVYGTLTAVLSARLAGGARLLVRIVGALFIAGIALSRLALGAHTPPDVATGLLIGLATLAFFLWEGSGRRVPAPSLRPLFMAVVVIVVGLQGHRLHAEEMLHAIGQHLKANTPFCPTPTVPTVR